MNRPDDKKPGKSGKLAAEQRRAVRDPVLLHALLRHRGLPDAAKVRIRNLSAAGVMAEYEGPVSVGDSVSIEIQGLGEVPGEIAWKLEGRMGIAFAWEVDPVLAHGQRKKARSGIGERSTSPAARRPGLRQR